jgi:hypothetical protein
LEKVDHKKVFKEFYRPPKKPVVVDVPEFLFLMIDGKGNPNEAQEYKDALEVLYGLSYTLKFSIKGKGRIDYKVMPLEGLWWVPGVKEFSVQMTDKLHWTSMIMQPDPVTVDDFENAKVQLKEKKDPVSLPKVRFESFKEGLCVQVMHIGPYSEEQPTVDALQSFAEREGYKLRDKHHEIYLGDPSRTAPERLKTVIRQPVE